MLVCWLHALSSRRRRVSHGHWRHIQRRKQSPRDILCADIAQEQLAASRVAAAWRLGKWEVLEASPTTAPGQLALLDSDERWEVCLGKMLAAVHTRYCPAWPCPALPSPAHNTLSSCSFILGTALLWPALLCPALLCPAPHPASCIFLPALSCCALLCAVLPRPASHCPVAL